jgi:hypothetical protein
VNPNDSLDSTNDEVILSLFPDLFECVSDLESELETSMNEVFRFDSGYFALVATTPTILIPSLLDTNNPSNMRIPSECHLTLSDTVDCIANPLLLKDFSQLLDTLTKSKAKAMMHGDEGIGVDGLKELDPGPYIHDSIHIDDIMEHGSSPIQYELVPSPPGTSNTSFLLSNKDIRPFLLSNSRQTMATLTAIPTISANHLEAELDCTIHTI